MNEFVRQNRLPFASWQAKPGDGEPAHSYFARLVGEGFQSSARVYANELEINGRNIVLKEILAELLTLPISEDRKQSLRRWTPVWNGKYHCLSGETLAKRQMSFYDRRFCRACLAEEPYHRTWWDIVEFRICPFHGTPIEKETSAGDCIKWWYPFADTAPSGEYLPRRLPRLTQTNSFEWYILSRLGFVSTRASPVLDAAPLHQVIEACRRVGRLMSNPWCSTATRTKPSDSRLGFEALCGSFAEAEATFAEWLNEHVPYVDLIRGINQAYGWFKWKKLSTDVRLVAKRAFVSVGRIGRQGLKEALPHRESTIKETAALIGADVRGLRKIAQQAGMALRNPSPSERAFLSPEQVQTLCSIACDLISVTDAADRLGCSQACVRELVSLGQLQGFKHTRLFQQKGNGLAVRAAEIDELLQRILSVGTDDFRGAVHGISYLCRRIEKSPAQIVVEVLDGGISVARLDPRRKGIAGWGFEASAHKKAFRRQVGDGEIRRCEAAQLIGCEQAIVGVLVAAGLIKESGCADSRSYLDRASFESFHRRFVNAKRYADELGCTKDIIGVRLRELGIRRWHAALPTPYEFYFVERKALEKALRSIVRNSEDPPVWKTFQKALSTVCPSFVLPSTVGDRDFKLKTATGATYVMLTVDGQDLIITKTFRKLAPREWAVFTQKQTQIRQEWSSFTWLKKTTRGEVTAKFRVRSQSDVAVAVEALRCLYAHFKNPRKLPRG